MISVGLNLIFLVPGETGGTETYAQALLAELAQTQDLRLTTFINRETEMYGPGHWTRMVRTITVPVRARDRAQWVRGEQLFLPRAAERAGVDIIHSLGNTAPARGSFHRVTTIHDLHFRRAPEAHLGLAKYGMSLLVPLAAYRSHRIITPSGSTKHDVASLLRVRASKIDVVPEGPGQRRLAEPMSAAKLRATLGLDDRPIILSVSAKRPHKNLARLIEAVGAIPAGARPQLVIPGYPTPHEQELRRLVIHLGLEQHVRLLGWVDAAQLEGLYGVANGLVCPSLHEGFGLPVLEAMVRGVPVACSGGGALAEVAGDAALIFDPHSIEQMSAAILHLVHDGPETARLRVAGFDRAAEFTWARTAEQTRSSYERALGSRP